MTGAPLVKFVGAETGAPFAALLLVAVTERVFNHVCDNVLVRPPESRRSVGRGWSIRSLVSWSTFNPQIRTAPRNGIALVRFLAKGVGA